MRNIRVSESTFSYYIPVQNQSFLAEVKLKLDDLYLCANLREILGTYIFLILPMVQTRIKNTPQE